MTFKDLLGTTLSYFRIGFTGPRLKDSSGNLVIRNPADSADAAVTASQVNVSGDNLVINSDAAESGNDWKLTVSRNSAATANLQLVAPPAKGTDGYVLRQKAGTASGVLELELAAVGSTSACRTTDTTNLAFGDSSPVTAFTLPANAVVNEVRVIVDESFDGTPSLSVGISGTTSKYMPTTGVDLTMAAETVFVSNPGKEPVGTTEDIILTYSAGGATAGAARVIVDYSVPA